MVLMVVVDDSLFIIYCLIPLFVGFFVMQYLEYSVLSSFEIILMGKR